MSCPINHNNKKTSFHTEIKNAERAENSHKSKSKDHFTKLALAAGNAFVSLLVKPILERTVNFLKKVPGLKNTELLKNTSTDPYSKKYVVINKLTENGVIQKTNEKYTVNTEKLKEFLKNESNSFLNNQSNESGQNYEYILKEVNCVLTGIEGLDPKIAKDCLNIIQKEYKIVEESKYKQTYDFVNSTLLALINDDNNANLSNDDLAIKAKNDIDLLRKTADKDIKKMIEDVKTEKENTKKEDDAHDLGLMKTEEYIAINEEEFEIKNQ